MSRAAAGWPWPGPRRILRDLGAENAVNAVVGFVFAASGPVAIVLSVGIAGNLSEAEIASWLFGAFLLNGFITIGFCLHWRQPLVFFWSIPGAVLVGPALTHMPFTDVLGAFYVTGLLMLLLGLSGWVGRAMALVPMPIVMGMVAGVFLRFGIDLVHAFGDGLWIALPMTVAFAAFAALPRLGRALPPLIAALLAGIAAVLLLEAQAPLPDGPSRLIVVPLVQMPTFSLQAMLELVVPLAITVLVVQNGQGVAILTAAGHRPPVGAIAAACGAGSIISATVGAVSTCLTGPVNAVLAQGRDPATRYSGGLVVAALGMAFGLFAPAVTRLLLAAPTAFIATIAGLAMLRPLQTAFHVGFRDRCTLGALVTFLVTVSDIAIASIGAAFWGLVLGLATSWLLEREDFRAAA